MEIITMSFKNRLTSITFSCLIATATMVLSTSVYADNGGAFIGGVLATKIIGNMRDRTAAEQQQADAAQQQAYATQQAAYAPPPQAAQPSAEQRIKELDKLAAGGYISPAEYKQKKQAIIDSL
jgi:predicted lipid-binding transport protein (Tim44 family)